MSKEARIYPLDSYWLFRWGHQGLITKYRHHQLEYLLHDLKLPQKSDPVELADEEYKSAQFSCKYGRGGDETFREFVKAAEKKKIASREELRVMVEGGDLRQKKDGAIVIKLPTIVAIVAVFHIIFCVFGFGYLSFYVFASPLTMLGKIILTVIFAAGFAVLGCISLYCAIRPYRVVRRCRLAIWEYITCWRSNRSAGLRLVK